MTNHSLTVTRVTRHSMTKETMTVTDADGTPHEIMVYTMNEPYRDQLLPVSSRYNAVVLQGVWMPGISPQQFYDADEKYRKSLQGQSRALSQETRSRTLTKPAAPRSGLFLWIKGEPV